MSQINYSNSTLNLFPTTGHIMMKKFNGRVAVITGASPGIARALALQRAHAGAELALSDVNETGLQETAAHIKALGKTPHVPVLDVASREALHQYAADVFAHFGQVHLVFNNAGVPLGV